MHPFLIKVLIKIVSCCPKNLNSICLFLFLYIGNLLLHNAHQVAKLSSGLGKSTFCMHFVTRAISPSSKSSEITQIALQDMKNVFLEHLLCEQE